MCAKHVFQTVNSPQKTQTSTSGYVTPSSSYIQVSFQFFFFFSKLQIIWQTCATVNVRYFPWGKLSPEGPGTLLTMGLPEIKGRRWDGAKRSLFIGAVTPHTGLCGPHHGDPLCGCDRTPIHSHTTHTQTAAYRRLTAPELV